MITFEHLTSQKGTKNLDVKTAWCNGICVTDSTVCGYYGLCSYTWNCIEHTEDHD